MALCLDCPKALADWLTDSGSLTAKLRQHSGGSLRVQRLAQRWARPLAAEASLLGLREGELALVREIVMFGREQAWVYARSIFTQDLLKGRLGFLAKRGNAPLGDVLFGNRYISRGFLAHQRYPACVVPAPFGDSLTSDPWARIGSFYCDGLPLLVTEVFLPDFSPV